MVVLLIRIWCRLSVLVWYVMGRMRFWFSLYRAITGLLDFEWCFLLFFRILFLILYVERFASAKLLSFLCFCLSVNQASSSGDRVLSGVSMSLFFKCVSAPVLMAFPSATIRLLILFLWVEWG